MEKQHEKTYEELLKERDALMQENAELAESVAALKKEKSDMEQDMQAMKNDLQRLEEKYRRAMKKIFGSNSEHIAMNMEFADQLSFFFNEAEITEDTTPKEKTVEIKGHKRTVKPKSGSLDDILTEDLPTTVVEHMPEEMTCPECGSEMEIIGKEVRRTLVLVPAHAEIREDWYYTAACMECKENGISTPIAEAERIPALIPGGFASPEAVAEIAYEKFVMYSPLYRQEQEWSRKGIKLSRQTMSNWLLTCSAKYLRPVYDELRRQMLNSRILHADETPVQVLHEEGRKPKSKSYMWLFMTGAHEERQVVLYNYDESRGSAVPIKFLEGFSGYLQTDGYSAYKSVPKVKHVGCMAHARRYFTDALSGMKAENRKGTAAEEGFTKTENILLAEKSLADLPPEERKKERLRVVKPLVDDLLVWARETPVLKGSSTAKGITYIQNQWQTFEPFFEDGRIELTNNRAERSIKPFVMGRKNWLFCNTRSGAVAAETYYSLIETAKFNSLSPYEYLKYVLKEAPGLDLKDPEMIEKLLPWNAPEYCKSRAES